MRRAPRIQSRSIVEAMVRSVAYAARAHALLHPLRTVRSRLRWPPIARERLLRASSFEELHVLARERRLEGFNGQIVRLKYLTHLAVALECTSFIETGTFLGWTTTAARHFLGLPVFTVELSDVWVHARMLARLLGQDRIEFRRGDSRAALREWLHDPRIGPRPLVYLDAHWFEDHPLRDEIRIAVDRGTCVLVIDDCRVEHDRGFGFDAYPALTTELAAVADLLPPGRATVLFPTHPSHEETGLRRGTMVVLVDLEHPRERLPAFVDALFAPFPR